MEKLQRNMVKVLLKLTPVTWISHCEPDRAAILEIKTFSFGAGTVPKTVDAIVHLFDFINDRLAERTGADPVLF